MAIVYKLFTISGIQAVSGTSATLPARIKEYLFRKDAAMEAANQHTGIYTVDHRHYLKQQTGTYIRVVPHFLRTRGRRLMILQNILGLLLKDLLCVFAAVWHKNILLALGSMHIIAHSPLSFTWVYCKTKGYKKASCRNVSYSTRLSVLLC